MMLTTHDDLDNARLIFNFRKRHHYLVMFQNPITGKYHVCDSVSWDNTLKQFGFIELEKSKPDEEQKD